GPGQNSRGIAAAVALAAAMGLALAGAPGPAGEAREILVGKTIEAELAPGSLHRYRVALDAGHGALVLATQTGIDVVLELRAPDGTEIALADARSSGTEPLPASITFSGSYEILVSASSPRAAPGRYALVVEAKPLDGPRGEAFRQHAAGRALASGKREDLPEARREFTAALAVWTAAGEPAMAAYTTQEIGVISLKLQEIIPAQEAFADAARRFEEL